MNGCLVASHLRNRCLFIRLDPIISYVPVQELKLSVVRFTVDSEVIGQVIVVFLVFTHVTNCLTTVAIRHVGVTRVLNNAIKSVIDNRK